MRVFKYNSAGTSIESDFTYYFITDTLGNINGILNSSGNLIVRYVYDAWGNVTTTDMASTTESSIAMENNPYLYRGYFYDAESGLYYLQSRYYNPQWGRFISADDVSYLLSESQYTNGNLYVYCNNNPVMYTDPSGHLPTSGFLQIPPRDGHPCLRLTVPTAKSVADFHRQVIAHAEHTKNKRQLPFGESLSLVVFRSTCCHSSSRKSLIR